VSLGSVHTVALVGLTGRHVQVQADVGGGLPGMILLGLPDASLSEARDRVRAAARNSGAPLSPRRITVNLVPAALPKRGPAFDVAILLACLEAEGLVSVPGDTVFLGELGLDGALRPLMGTLPCVLAARELGFACVVLPRENAEEAALVPGIRVRPYAHVAALLAELGADPSKLHAPRPAGDGGERTAGERSASGTGSPASRSVDLAEVVGQATGRHALEVAAAGAHHVLLKGPPGAGKTMLAERLPTILPPLSEDEAVLSACLRSVGGQPVSALDRRPPFQAPHHTTSTPALVGGGSGVPRPGAASLAHGGVLFLDEAAEFAARTLDALREPLESGSLTLHRSGGTASYPARFQLVMATNPCPCGKPTRECECSALVRRRYWARLSGPLLDRIDLRVTVPAASTKHLVAGGAGEASSAVRARVEAARAAQAERWAPHGAAVNARVPGAVLRSDRFRPAGAAGRALAQAASGGTLTARGVDRVLRIAWSLADLAGRTSPGPGDIESAAVLRGEEA